MGPSGFAVSWVSNFNRSLFFGATRSTVLAKEEPPWKGSHRVVAIRCDPLVLHEQSVLR